MKNIPELMTWTRLKPVHVTSPVDVIVVVSCCRGCRGVVLAVVIVVVAIHSLVNNH